MTRDRAINILTALSLVLSAIAVIVNWMDLA